MNSPRRLRILQVFNRYADVGGEEAAVENITKVLSLRHEVEECLFASADWLGPDGPPRWKQPFLAWRNPQAVRTFQTHCRRFRPDCAIFHNTFPVGSAALYPTARKLDLPVIQFIHNFRPFSVNGYLWAQERLEPAGLEKNFLPEILAGSWQGSRAKTAFYAATLLGQHFRGDFNRVSGWIAISNFLREKFAVAGIEKSRIHVLHHSWKTIAPPVADRGNSWHFLYLGRLITAKGVRGLLETWKIIEKSQGDKTPRLVIAGEGPLGPEVERAAAGSKYVTYAGRVSGSEKMALISNCTAMIAPSLWWEALGLVTYEAYDFGKPMLAAASGGLTETVFHEVTGLLHSPGDTCQFAEHVMRLAKNPLEAEAMGQAGKVWLQQNADEEQWLNRFDKILQKIIQQSSASSPLGRHG